MKTALITGAYRGIGLETARQLLENGYHVYLESRELNNGLEAMKKLKSEGFASVEAVQLDVTNENSAKAARVEIGRKTNTLDVLINNAGINGGQPPYTAVDATPDQFLAAFTTNVVGTAIVTQAFLDLLRKSPEPRIVNVSTSVGSLSLQSNPDWLFYSHAKYAVYASSKAALNMYTIHLAYELRDTPFKVNAVCPGYTSTDFTGNNGGDVETAARRIAKYAMIGQDGPTGKYFSEESNPEGASEIPW